MKGAFSALAVITCIYLSGIAALAQQPADFSQTQQPPSVTEVSADLGSCSVEFKATDMRGQPLYNAKIKTQIRYGFMNKRKLDLEAGTNADGRARFINMPEQVKSPLVFEAYWGNDKTTITWDPGNNCNAQYPILLGKKAGEQE
jgi:hypothetical protein